ncbi:HlyD family type I secretion periplasmic adaptor subunit [Dyadobacter beijingensis]|uniref:HlyD family type I secretion periplasmic adaptor subunit n=1 Tax=Dyadobacter beijingensis TaxID=365489 RepID=A0ABQ2HUS5_9BACT|nr:HlyD family efflux transporter periplasmic adaptor subunit [Dyadobacter beijingensis]GGM90494.1 HlyD family type I secretion periplasmic adaptor subunit [Dyadobacter beijingensis]
MDKDHSSTRNKIFPPEILEYTSDYHFHQHHTRSNLIYQLLLLIIIVGFISMFLIAVDVSVRSTGIIRASDDRNEIKALVSGRLDSVFVAENQRVEKGQTLLKIEAEIIKEQNQLVKAQKTDFDNQIRDLKVLLHLSRTNNWSKKPGLVSGLYKQDFALFWQKITDAKTTLLTVEKDFARNKILHDVKAISEAEFDKAVLLHTTAKNRIKTIMEEEEARWESELTQLQMKSRELNSQDQQYLREKDYYVVKAPISGTIQQLKGLRPGSIVASNEFLAEISPDEAMIAEMYVLPKDIGLIHPGTLTRLQVDAYNYNQWGLVTGRVLSISNDVYTDGKQPPYFKVRCKLDKSSLTLKSGYEGKLKKGMTLQARFLVTERTLFQLLYDKADDWLNPNLVATTETPPLN